MNASVILLLVLTSLVLTFLFSAIAYFRYRVFVSPPATDADGFVAMAPIRRLAHPDIVAPQSTDDTPS